MWFVKPEHEREYCIFWFFVYEANERSFKSVDCQKDYSLVYAESNNENYFGSHFDCQEP